MAATTENTLYYQIVLDATAAIEALREFGATGKEFEAVVKEEEAFINQLVETYGAGASVIASVMRKMNSDISASNRERIKDTMEGEEQIKAALLQEREAYVALDAAIAQATRNIAGREADVPAPTSWWRPARRSGAVPGSPRCAPSARTSRRCST